MARITVEDCMEKVPNRFHLVQMAAIRTKQLMKGAQPLVSGEVNKSIVMSLREIAEGFVKPNYPEELPELGVEASEPVAPIPALPELPPEPVAASIEAPPEE